MAFRPDLDSIISVMNNKGYKLFQKTRVTKAVHKWSAGCQVVQDPDHFAFLMALCERGREKYGNSFSYTLLEENDLN